MRSKVTRGILVCNSRVYVQGEEEADVEMVIGVARVILQDVCEYYPGKADEIGAKTMVDTRDGNTFNLILSVKEFEKFLMVYDDLPVSKN